VVGYGVSRMCGLRRVKRAQWEIDKGCFGGILQDF
jgi:hypothetical protein